jgi:hypothetical protein
MRGRTKLSPKMRQALQFVRERNTRGRAGAPAFEVVSNTHTASRCALIERGLLEVGIARKRFVYRLTRRGRRAVSLLGL